jgi:hypothetical protein
MPNVTWTFAGDTKDLEAALKLLGGEVKRTEDALDDLGDSGAKSVNKLSAVAEKARLALASGLGTGLATGAAGAVLLAKETVALTARMDGVAKAAKRVGGSAEDLQALRGAFGLAGVGVQTLDNGLEKFRVNLGKAADGTGEQADALAKLGLRAADLEAIPLPQRMALIAERLKGVASEGDRAYISTALFGGAGRDLVPALEQGGQALQDSIDLVRSHGVVSNEAAAASEALQDQIALATQTFGNLRDSALVPLIPAMSDLIQAAQDIATSLRDSSLPEYTAMLADLASGAIRAARALGILGLAQQDNDASARDAARRQIQDQSERVDAIREELKAAQAFDDLLSTAQGQSVQSQQTADLTAELERQLGVLRRLRGELDLEAGLGGRPGAGAGAPGRPSAGVPQPQAAAAAPTAAGAAPAADPVDDYAAAWRDATAAVDAADASIGKVLDRGLSASEKLIRAKEREEAEIVRLVNEAVSGQVIAEDTKLRIIEDGHKARLALEEQLQADLAALQQQEVDQTRAVVEEVTTLWDRFRADWNDGLGEMVNAVLGMASQVFGIAAGLAGDVASERKAAAEETQRAIARIEGRMAEATSDIERDRLASSIETLQAQERAQKEAALKAFRVQKALSLVQAGIQTALAVVNAIATAPNIIAGLVLAGVAATLGGIQIGIIAAKQPPTFHRGGVLRASDVTGSSMDRVAVHAKPGEGFLSTTGVAAAGGPDGVDRLNAGFGGGGGETINIIRFGTRTTETISHEQLRPRTGRMQQELRGLRPRVGRSIPGRR